MKSARVAAICSACGTEIFRTAPIYLVPILRNAEEARCNRCDADSKWHYLYNTGDQRALERIAGACSQLDIPIRFLGRALSLRNTAQRGGVLRGRDRLGLLAASLYLACRQEALPIRSREVARACKVSVTKLNRNYRILRADLSFDVPVANPAAFMLRLSHKLSVSSATIRAAKRVLEEAYSKGVFAGRDPMGLAAAAIYIGGLLTDSWIGQKQVAKAAGVTDVTLRNSYRIILDALSDSVRDEIVRLE